MSDETRNEGELARRVGLFSLIVYGVGDMVGAGIYGTIGIAAGLMGNTVWLAFLVSMVAAMLTGLSYASLSSRYPRAGGAAYIMQRAYRRPLLSYVVGLSVTASGLTSMAAGANVFSQTLNAWFPLLDTRIALVIFLLGLGMINFIGIQESMTANLICTAIEVGGLILVIIVGARYWGSVDYLKMPEGETLTASFLLSGAVLTFYAFVGFEDMLNVGEEVKQPETTMPRAIIIALIFVTLLYIAVSMTAVSVVPAKRLADFNHGAPLSQIMSIAAPWLPPWIYNVITVFAVSNTALLNYIMGSRMLYGMARQRLVPAWLGSVHPKTRTPHVAILTLGVVVLTLAFLGNIAQLASATSLLLLGCFCLMNLALVILQKREKGGTLEIPMIIPLLGIAVCIGLIIARMTARGADLKAPLIAGSLVAILIGMYLLRNGKRSKKRNIPL